MNTKAFIITRDRVHYTRKCYEALSQNALLDVYVVDHGSTYPLMRQWLYEIPRERLILRGDQRPRDFWSEESRAELLPIIGEDTPFIVTDCDIIPATPVDVFRWKALLKAYPDCVKVGSTLITSDIDRHYVYNEEVQRWESAFSQKEVETHVYDAPIDTTLAMYRRLEPFQLSPALRDGRVPARHLTWYETSLTMTADLIWYKEHLLDGSSHWNSERPWG